MKGHRSDTSHHEQHPSKRARHSPLLTSCHDNAPVANHEILRVALEADKASRLMRLRSLSGIDSPHIRQQCNGPSGPFAASPSDVAAVQLLLQSAALNRSAPLQHGECFSLPPRTHACANTSTDVLQALMLERQIRSSLSLPTPNGTNAAVAAAAMHLLPLTRAVEAPATSTSSAEALLNTIFANPSSRNGGYHGHGADSNNASCNDLDQTLSALLATEQGMAIRKALASPSTATLLQTVQQQQLQQHQQQQHPAYLSIAAASLLAVPQQQCSILERYLQQIKALQHTNTACDSANKRGTSYSPPNDSNFGNNNNNNNNTEDGKCNDSRKQLNCLSLRSVMSLEPASTTLGKETGSMTSGSRTTTTTAATNMDTPTMDPEGSSTISYEGDRIVPLATKSEKWVMSEYQCMLRQQIVFVENSLTESKNEGKTQGRNIPIVPGQVGILCKHCAQIAPRNRPRGSIYYPAKLHRIYQAAQNMAHNHFTTSCQSIPPDIRNQLVALKERKAVTVGAGKEYWLSSAISSGVRENEHGLFFQGS